MSGIFDMLLGRFREYQKSIELMWYRNPLIQMILYLGYNKKTSRTY